MQRTGGIPGNLRAGKPDRAYPGVDGSRRRPVPGDGGQVFLTEGYKGAPFGLSIVVPAKAGPFTLSGTRVQATWWSGRRSTSIRTRRR